MARKYLVDQYCENEVFGLRKIVDDSDYSIHHRLMENNFVRNDEVDFQYGIYLHYFFVVEKMCSFHFVLLRIMVDHESLLSLELVVVHFDFE